MTFDKYLNQLVLVAWDDPATVAGWPDPGTVTPGRVSSVGWVTRINDTRLWLASSRMPDEEGEFQYGDVTVLPLGVITAVVQLRMGGTLRG